MSEENRVIPPVTVSPIAPDIKPDTAKSDISDKKAITTSAEKQSKKKEKRGIKEIVSRLVKHKKDKKKYVFQKLTPVQDASIETYSEALDFVFQENDIRNIAITGTYGSGKSSVIETYENQHKKLKFIHLSLAHFDNDDTQNINPETEERGKRTIEGQLLNQLIQQIPKKKIPETQFGIKQDRKKRHYVGLAFLVSLCLLLFFCFIRNEEVMDIVLHIKTEELQKFFLFILKPDHIVLRTIILLVPLTFVLYKFLFYLARKKFIHKLNVQGNEIELFNENNKDSFFDKYLNEILYLFEHSKADAVIFEDIDRFKNTFVFERLHQINTLLHERQKMKIHKSKKISRFFYLVRDDLFNNNINKDRTKFFDFIIPIVPVVDGANSYEKLRTLFSEEDLKMFNNRFLRRICVFIDDYRILKNIYNEFYIYNMRLSESNLDCNKLLAMIVYKNIFPRDFAELQFNRGFVHTVLEATKNAVKIHNQQKHTQLYDLNLERKNKEAEWEKELYELEKENKRNERNMEGVDLLDWKEEYERRKEKISYDEREYKEYYNEERESLESSILPDRYYLAKDLLRERNIDSILKDYLITRTEDEDEELMYVQTNVYYRLLINLLEEGYIDETYSDYMSAFYSGSLTANDKKYIRKVIERKTVEESDYDMHIDNVEAIMECLELSDFSYGAILNCQLFGYLLSVNMNTVKESSADKQLSKDMIAAKEKMIQLIVNDKNYAFIKRYICSQRNIHQMVESINNSGRGVSWLFYSKMQPDILRFFIYKTLATGQYNRFEVSKYISRQSEYIDKEIFMPLRKGDKEVVVLNKERIKEENILHNLTISAEELGAIEKAINGLKIKYDRLNGDTISKEFFEYLYESNLYEINTNNIQVMITKGCKKRLDEEFYSKFMSFILVEDNPFCQYMREQLNDVMKEYYKLYDGQISDPENIVIQIINNNNINMPNTEEYVNRLVNKVKMLNQIESPKCQSLLLHTNAVEYTGDNILYYYKKNSLDDALIAFINSDNSKIAFSDESNEDDIKKFKEDCAKHHVTLNI